MPQPPTSQRWILNVEREDAVVTLSGDWLGADAVVNPSQMAGLLSQDGLASLAFDSHSLGRWDSSLLLFLSELRQLSTTRKIEFDPSGVPHSARHLLELLPVDVAVPTPPHPRVRLVDRVGSWCLDRGREFERQSTLLGSILLRIAPGVRGKTQMRWVDLLTTLQNSGIRALPVVALVNVLVGGILAFMGAIQLRRFGADIYVADLVGIAIVREMGPLMTAVVMCGRTGGAYAAEIATMNGSEEIDALQVIGIPLDDYLVLPRVSALAGMMPLLYLYGSAVGIAGGFAVALMILRVSPVMFFHEMRANVTAGEIVFGLIKSVVFGLYIGIVSCRIGLAAGRSSADVGHAATTATVTGIVGVIVIDAIFAVCANAINL